MVVFTFVVLWNTFQALEETIILERKLEKSLYLSPLPIYMCEEVNVSDQLKKIADKLRIKKLFSFSQLTLSLGITLVVFLTCIFPVSKLGSMIFINAMKNICR